MPSADLPERPHVDQLRHQAKELRDAARTGDPAALERVHRYWLADSPVTLSTAQLVVAREYGFASWAALKEAVEARASELAERVSMFLRASVTGSRSATRLLHGDPAIASYDIRTAAVLGDADRVGQLIARDPAGAARADAEPGWPPLLYVCMSRWHYLAPDHAAGMVRAARLLLDAGADPNTTIGETPNEPGYCSPLFAAAGRANNPAITALLLERGARPEDHTVYLAAFHASRERSGPLTGRGLRVAGSHSCLKLLLRNGGLPPGSTALAAPIALGDVEGVRLMLDAGADPNQLLPAELLGQGSAPPVCAAIRAGCPARLVELLLDRGGNANGAGGGGRSPYRLAARCGAADVMEVLRRHGAHDDTTTVDRFLYACGRADRIEALRLLRDHPGLLDELNHKDLGAIVDAAGRGDTDAVRLMLDTGFPRDVHAGPDGATPLHAAAASGSAHTARMLIDAGADLEARDTTYGTSPLSWAVVGSGLCLGHNPDPDWVGTVCALLDAGADPEQAWAGHTSPQKDVARILVERGIDIPGKDPAAIRHGLNLDNPGAAQ